MKVLNPFVEFEINSKVMPAPTIPAQIDETYSQCYEDVILESLLRAHIKTHGAIEGIVFVEIGANHPVCTSSSFLFRNRYGMKTYLVEANPK